MRYLLVGLFILSLLSFREIPVYTKAEVTGHFDPSVHPQFSRVPDRWTDQATYLRRNVKEAFLTMASDAQKDGINLRIISGTRNHERQAEIWTEKWNRFEGTEDEKATEILKYSSMPGTSRHHWGTDFDLNSVESAYFENGKGKQIWEWLDANAWKYGFFQPYNALGDHRNVGYKEEKWHWSYYPEARRIQKVYNTIVQYEDIDGFNGSELSAPFKVFDHYVNAIHIPEKVKRNN